MAKGYDWERIEADYRTGKFTLRELAAKHGPSNQAIAKRAKAEGWTKDLRDLIRQETNAALIGQRLAEGGQRLAEAAAAAVITNVSVIEGHRSLTLRLRGIVDTLSSELERGGVDDDGATMSLKGRIEAADKLAAASAKLVPLERKAHGLDDDGSSEGSMYDQWCRENLL